MSQSLESELFQFLREGLAQRTGIVIDEITAESVLVDLGLQSIDAVLLCGDIEDRFSIEMDPADIFEHNTLGSFADSILARAAG